MLPSIFQQGGNAVILKMFWHRPFYTSHFEIRCTFIQNAGLLQTIWVVKNVTTVLSVLRFHAVFRSWGELWIRTSVKWMLIPFQSLGSSLFHNPVQTFLLPYVISLRKIFVMAWDWPTFSLWILFFSFLPIFIDYLGIPHHEP